MPSSIVIEGGPAGATSAAGPDTLDIAAHVDPSTGNIDSPADVRVGGNVVDRHSVRAAGAITVGGVIEAAAVTAGTDLTATGGVAGKYAAVCTVGGSVRARYVRQATVEAAGTVSVQTEITDARVITGQDIRADGDVVGGHLTAAGSVACNSAGSPAGTATLIEVATDEWLRRAAAELIPEINRCRTTAAKNRSAVGPLMRNPKLLTPQQKEQATELLFEADTAEEAVETHLTRLCTLYSRSVARPPATFVVQGTLHAGVTLRIGGYEARVTASLPGPIGVRLRSSPGRHSFQVISCADKSSVLLAANPVQDPVMEQLRKEIAGRV